MDAIFVIIAIIICLLIEMFYSGSEIALVVADKLRLKTRAEQGDSNARASQWLIHHPAQFFSTVILGTNISVVAASTIATFYLISNYGRDAEAWALMLAPIILVFGEVLPKSLFQHYADKIAPRLGPILVASTYAMFPMVWPLSKFTKFLLGGVERHMKKEPLMTREELALFLAEIEDSGDMQPSEMLMATRILELANRRVKNVMVPLAMMENIPIDATRETALAVFDLKGFSKLPVFEHRAYNIIGVIDCLDCLFEPSEKKIRDLLKPVLYVPKGMSLHNLYLTMRHRGEDVAIVVDEYGAAVGLVTLEDLLEEIVGEIRDEHEISQQHYVRLGEGHYLVSGRMEVEEANEKLRLEIPKGDYETVAGLLLTTFGYLPQNGETVQIGRWRYIVREATEKAILEVEAVGG